MSDPKSTVPVFERSLIAFKTSLESYYATMSVIPSLFQKKLELLFLESCALGDIFLITHLIQQGINVHCTDSLERNAAHYVAMRRGSVDQQLFIGIYQKHYRKTPTEKDIETCLKNRLSVIKILLRHEVTFDYPNTSQNTSRKLIYLQQSSYKALGEERDIDFFVSAEFELHRLNAKKSAFAFVHPAFTEMPVAEAELMPAISVLTFQAEFDKCHPASLFQLPKMLLHVLHEQIKQDALGIGLD